MDNKSCVCQLVGRLWQLLVASGMTTAYLFMLMAVGCAMAPVRGHAAAFYETVAWVSSGRRMTQLCRPRGGPGCPPRTGRPIGRVLRDGGRGPRAQSCHVPG